MWFITWLKKNIFNFANSVFSVTASIISVCITSTSNTSRLKLFWATQKTNRNAKAMTTINFFKQIWHNRYWETLTTPLNLFSACWKVRKWKKARLPKYREKGGLYTLTISGNSINVKDGYLILPASRTYLKVLNDHKIKIRSPDRLVGKKISWQFIQRLLQW